MKPKVSIVMLAYNTDKYIETAIKSIIRQKTNYPIQLVIAEDCSTDNTLEICTKYFEKYPDKITLLRREKNLGLQANFIDAHSHCTGEYIAMCDGDDYWTDKYKLQRMTDFMDNHPEYAICFHRVINYYEEDHSKSLSNGGQKQIMTLQDLAMGNTITNASSLFRRGYYSELPEWLSEITLCDYAVHMLNAQHGKIYYFKKPMAVYRKHKKALWSKVNREKQLNSALLVREKLLLHFKNDLPTYEKLKVASTNILFALLNYYESIKNNDKSNHTKKAILSLNPEWTLPKLEEMQRNYTLTLKPSLKKKLFSVLSSIRQEASKFVSLPKI